MTDRTVRTVRTSNMLRLPSWFSWAARIALAAIFVAAALPKLAEPGVFAADLQNYRLLPDAWLGPLAALLPVLELIVALALLVPSYQRGAALLCTGLLLVFSVAMAQSRLRGIDLKCGCFGAALEAKVSWWTVARSSVLALLAGLVTLGGTRATTATATGASSTQPNQPS